MKSTHLGFRHLASVLCFGAYALQATTFTVTRTNVTGPGSLPVIISQANTTLGDNVIEFAVTNVIVLVSPLPTVTNNVTINGRIDVPTVISGGGTVPIFTFAAGTTNILSNLVLTNGYTTGSGAAISNAGLLYISGCRITGNRAPAASGGGIGNFGSTTIANSALDGNSSSSGGAIHNSGVMSLSLVRIQGNSAGNGGGVVNGGSLSVTDSILSNNVASLGFGGAILNSGSLKLVSSTITGNTATGEAGKPGQFVYFGIDFTPGGGGGAGLGGGIMQQSGNLFVTNCTIAANNAHGGNGGGAGGAYASSPNQGGSGGGNNAGLGGIYYGPGTSDVAPTVGGLGGGGGGAALLYWNNVNVLIGADGGFGGGGAGTGGGARGGSSGFGGGSGGYGYNNYPVLRTGGGGGGGAGLGGGLFIEQGAVILVNCTLTENGTLGGAGGLSLTNPPLPYGPTAGNPGSGVAGGVFNHSGTLSLLNTITAGNSAGSSSPDLCGAFISSGFNLIGNNQGATGLSINDYQNVPADLGPLQDNGGPTLTCALLQGSLAIGAGTSIGAPPTDQRGVARPPGRCDIGAFQLLTLITPTIQWTNPADIDYGTPLGSSQLNATVGPAGTLTYTPPAGTFLSPGSNQVLRVVFSPADPTQYTGATNSVHINVLKASQTITFGPIPNHQLGDAPVLLSASDSSSLPVTLAVLSGPATLTGNLLSFGSTTGWVTVAATQPGNANYNAAPEVDQSFYLGIFPLPAITTQPASQSVYPGDRVSFTVTATNGPLSYQWQFYGANIAGGTSPNLVLARVQTSEAGPYRVILSNPSGSIISAVANLTVIVSQGTPRITAQPQGQNIRVGEIATLSVVATGNAPLSYQWYQGASGDTNGFIAGATNLAYTASGLTTNTSFWVSVHNALGTVDSAAANVAVFPAKAARLNLTRLSGMAALVIDGLPGTQYRLDYTTNLSTTSWSNVINLVLPSSPYTFIDATSLNAPLRFYRAVAQ